jgi:hypothetical protein
MKQTVSQLWPPRVKIKVNDDGERQFRPKWHYAVTYDGTGNHALCTGEYFGLGESACVYDFSRGRITCSDCIEIIKKIKSIRL